MDADRFGVLYDRYTAKVYQKCMGMTQDKELAKDLTHDIFLKAFVNLSKFDHRSQIQHVAVQRHLQLLPGPSAQETALPNHGIEGGNGHRGMGRRTARRTNCFPCVPIGWSLYWPHWKPGIGPSC